MLTWIGLLFFCSAATPVLCCDWLRQYGHYSNVSLVLVDQLGGPMTEQECPVSFPYGLYTHMRNAKVESQLFFIRESLQQISNLFLSDNLSPVPWESDRTEHFLIIIHRQTDELNSCVTHRKPERRLRRYYRKLARETLYRTGGSPASWELIRKETKLHLLQLDVLVASIRGSAAASRGRSALH